MTVGMAMPYAVKAILMKGSIYTQCLTHRTEADDIC
jgi:hypothetical protein